MLLLQNSWFCPVEGEDCHTYTAQHYRVLLFLITEQGDWLHPPLMKTKMLFPLGKADPNCLMNATA